MICECNGSGFVEVWPTDPLIPVRASFERCEMCSIRRSMDAFHRNIREQLDEIQRRIEAL